MILINYYYIITQNHKNMNSKSQIIKNTFSRSKENTSLKSEDTDKSIKSLKTTYISKEGIKNHNRKVGNLKNENIVNVQLVNNIIYGREKEKEQLKEFLLSKEKKILYVTGQPGTGKTSVINHILNSNSDNNIIIKELGEVLLLSVNCYSVRDMKEVFKLFFDNLNMKMKSNQEKYKSLLEYSNTFKHNEKNIRAEEYKDSLIKLIDLMNNQITPILLLDEIDGMYYSTNNKRNSLKNYISYNDLLKIPLYVKGNFKIILISNNPEFDKELFNQIQNKNILIDKIVFSPYTKVDAYEIIFNMLNFINLSHFFDSIALKFLCEKSVGKTGDIRKAIENTQVVLISFIKENKIVLNNMNNLNISQFKSCHKIIKDEEDVIHKDNEENSNKITFKYVNSKLKFIGDEIIEAMKSITTEQKIVLVSIFRLMREDEDIVEFKEKDIFSQYTLLKKSKFNQSNSLRGFDDNLKALVENGILDKKNGKAKIYKILRFTYNDLRKIFEDDTVFLIENEG